MDLPRVIAPWLEVVRQAVPGLELFDAHTHIGQNDPDGMRQSPESLLAMLGMARAEGAFVFPMHEPEGYPPANDAVIAAAAASGGRLIPFCRLDPHTGDPVTEAERALAAGARGIKLHPRAERFTLDHPQVDRIVALAGERTLPVLIHAGRGIPALGRDSVELAARHPGARLILAHAGICDLSWIWRVAADHPNLLFDSAWWMPADLLTLFSLVPPGQILFASDSPYGATPVSAAFQLRIALAAGLTPDQVRVIACDQARRITAGEPLIAAGGAIGERERAPHPLLDRIADFLIAGTLATMRGSDAGGEMLALAALACDVPPDCDDAPVAAAVAALLQRYEESALDAPEDRRRLALLVLALSVARTPELPVPAPG